MDPVYLEKAGEESWEELLESQISSHEALETDSTYSDIVRDEIENMDVKEAGIELANNLAYWGAIITGASAAKGYLKTSLAVGTSSALLRGSAMLAGTSIPQRTYQVWKENNRERYLP